MTGSKQQAWFFNEMTESADRGATWRLVMQQVVFAPVNYSIATQGSASYTWVLAVPAESDTLGLLSSTSTRGRVGRPPAERPDTC